MLNKHIAIIDNSFTKGRDKVQKGLQSYVPLLLFVSINLAFIEFKLLNGLELFKKAASYYKITFYKS